jgi:8-oxo-dGTP pyrophosphatase MutT (NUDIX family)
MKYAAIAIIERPEDERLLCVWNGRYGCWSFPGGMVEEGETVEEALARELREEAGLTLVTFHLLYDGPHGVASADPTRAKAVRVYRVTAAGVPREMEIGRPVTWLTREEFLKWSAFAVLYERVFALMPPQKDNASDYDDPLLQLSTEGHAQWMDRLKQDPSTRDD